MPPELRLLSRVSYRDEEIAGPRLRGLFALLAGDLRTGSSSARLIEGLWPDVQPENPAKALQILVSRTRSQLAPELIASTPTGYRLALDDEQVDTAAVLLHMAESARLARAGDHAASLAQADAGLALWDGPPVVAEESDDPLDVLRAERAATYRSLARGRALALSRLGRHSEALELLSDQAARLPHDEELLGELLRSEAAVAGPGAALTRYEAYRGALRDELGTDPGGALQAEYQRLLQATTPPVWHGVSYEPNQLVGRVEDIAAVTELLRESRVVSVVGVGGLGKTRLAQAVSRQAEQRVVTVVALAGVVSDDDVLAEVAAVLGVGEAGRGSVGPMGRPTDILTGVVSAVGSVPTLLVLDNCEHVLSGVAELVYTLVSMTGDLRVLTTSRAPLDLTSEAVYRLPELGLSTSVELFEQRAAAARPDVDVPPDVVTALCERLDGLPLAIELAAARVRVMTVAEIAARLDDRFGLLRGGPRDSPERHHTLHGVVDWSWNLLQPAGQAAMRALSIFSDGFSTDAAAQVLGEADDVAVLDILEALADQSLLQVSDAGSTVRFRMLETVREFSAARREEAGETDRTTDRFLAWAREFGRTDHDAVFGPDAFPAAERIRAEQDNLLQATRIALARADAATVAATTALLGSLWTVDASYTRMLALIDETEWLLSHVRPDPDLLETTRTAVTLCALNTFMLVGPRATRSVATIRRLPLATPDTFVGAIAVLFVTSTSDPDPATLHALADSDQPLLAGVTNLVLSYWMESEGELDDAFVAARRALDALENQPNVWTRVSAHLRFGELCLHAELGAEGRHHLSTALRILDEAGPWTDVLQIRWAMVLASLQLGDIDEAERWLEVAGREGTADVYGRAVFDLGCRAEIQLARGHVEAGLRLWRRAVEQLDAVATPSAHTAPSDNDPWGPWALGVRAVAVVAHARHDRIVDVRALVDGMAPTVRELLVNPAHNPPSYVLPTSGAVLLALGLVDVDHGRRDDDESALASGVRLIALAERMRFLREFQPTMSAAWVRATAEDADGPTYADAVSTYAGLDAASLPEAALAILQARGPE